MISTMSSVLRVMSLNTGGGDKQYYSSENNPSPEQKTAMAKLVADLHPDVLCVQEVAQYIDADGILHSMVDQIRTSGNFEHYMYGETLSMKRHMQVKKEKMINGLFLDWWDWSKGNAIFSRYPFSRLGDETKEGTPRNVPIFQPITYEGSRDTDPRYVILSRIKHPPYPFILNLHLTTLVGERGISPWPDVVDAARLTRQQQLSRIVTLVRTNVLDKKQPLIMMGDFNATPDEYALKEYLEKEVGFVRLTPTNDIATHKQAGTVDHIYFAPTERLIDYECWIEDQPLSHQVSDHLSVLAEIKFE